MSLTQIQNKKNLNPTIRVNKYKQEHHLKFHYYFNYLKTIKKIEEEESLLKQLSNLA